MDYYEPTNSLETLLLRRVSSSVENLSVEQGDPHAASYTIKVSINTNFLKTLSLAISREQNQLSTKVGEGRFEKYSAFTTSRYAESSLVQDLHLQISGGDCDAVESTPSRIYI